MDTTRSLLREAVRAHLSQCDNNVALVAALELRSQCEEIQDRAAEADALLLLSDVHMASRNERLALHVLEEAQAIFARLGDKQGEGNVLEKLMKVHALRGETGEALKRADRRAMLLRNEAGEAAALHALASVFFMRREFQQSVTTATRARSLFRLFDKSQEALVLQDMTDALLELGMFDEALDAARSAAAIFDELGDRHAEVEITCKQTSIFIASKAYKNAEDAARHALILSLRADGRCEAAARRNLIDALEKMGNTHLASQEAAALAAFTQRLGDKREHALALTVQAGLFLTIGKLDDVGALASGALGLAKEARDVKVQLSVYDLLINLARRRGDEEGQMQAAREATLVAHDAKDARGEASALRQVVDINRRRGNLEEALFGAKEVALLCKSLGDCDGEAAAKRAVAELYLGMGMPWEAKWSAKEALALLRKLGKTESASLVQIVAGVAAEGSEVKLEDAENAVRLCREAGDRRGEARSLQLLAHVTFEKMNSEASDDPGLQEAGLSLQRASDAVRCFREIGDKLGEASALHTSASVLLLTRRTDEALSASREALDLYGELGEECLELYEMVLLGKIYLQLGHHAKARKFATLARNMFSEVNDTRGLDSATALLGKL